MGAIFSDLVENSQVPITAPSEAAFDRALSDLQEVTESGSDLYSFLEKASPARDALISAISLSPHLRDIAVRDPDIAWNAVCAEPAPYLDELISQVAQVWRGDGVETALMANLRRLKQRFSFALALYDLCRLIKARDITSRLSAFANGALSSTVNHLLLSAHHAGKLELLDLEDPGKGSGLSIIGMGKLGAGELNYSSDIDLIVIYDPARSPVVSGIEAADIFPRLTRRLVHIMQERTGQGYVFRTDLRLRPDPGSTPLAIPYDSAMVYYEGRGQNWERAAFIKARPVAGDPETGTSFCNDIAPFIFRKYLDYGAIADIHSIKRQIHAHRGFGTIALRGHNIKLGRGGIREIEFFVQTQQLIAGGRMPELRIPATEDALCRLAEARWIDDETRTALHAAYWFLRDLEHRIQMRRDEQTHTLPEMDEELLPIALKMGFAGIDEFLAALSEILHDVEKRYAALFENDPQESEQLDDLVFTGDEDDPETLETLRSLGFERASDVSRIIRTWNYGRYRATQSAAARKHLHDLMPRLIRTFAANGRADETVIRFDTFLSGLPSGIQLFSLLKNNPALLSLIVNIMSSAPRMADVIARRPHVFDGLLDPTLLAELPTRSYLSTRLEAFLDGDFLYEEILDRLRIFASEQKFLIGVRLLTGSISGARAGQAYSDLASLIVGVAAGTVQVELEKAHGSVEGGRIAIVAMGKLGSREMTAESDIDIILLYAHDKNCLESDGPKPLDPPRYFARLTQRLVAALSAPTAEGVLYEVDLRLRPSGNKGPVATHIAAFKKYQLENAWTWEHMALTRARIVHGEASLAREAETIFSSVLDQRREKDQTVLDIADMRARIAGEKPPDGEWDLKLIPGGLIDIEFIAQYMRLMAVTDGIDPGDADTQTALMLKALGPASVGESNTETLLSALNLYSEISQVTRLCLEPPFDPHAAPVAFQELLLKACDLADIPALQTHIQTTANSVREIFEKTIGSPKAE